MTQSALLHWEDFPVGKVLEMGGLTVTREEILAFARQFDPQPFHVDEEAARHSIFGGLAASGWHTASLAMRMWCDGILLRAASSGSPGVEKIRWLKPVRPGDTLRLRVKVVEARPMASKPHLGLVRNEWTVLNQDGEPVMEMDGWGILRRRDAG
jgi:acyl dehydratase